MTEDSQGSDHRVRQADVPGLPFTAGVVLGISGLNTFLQGLYTIDYWQGWFFLVVGIIVAGTAAMLIFHVRGAQVAALVAAVASLIISAVWVATYHWFNLAAIGLDLVAIYALVRSQLRSRAGRDPLRT
jgi:CHASE2 domain-containing sensor protein